MGQSKQPDRLWTWKPWLHRHQQRWLVGTNSLHVTDSTEERQTLTYLPSGTWMWPWTPACLEAPTATSSPARRKEAGAPGSRSLLAVTAVPASILATGMRIHLLLFMLNQSCNLFLPNIRINIIDSNSELCTWLFCVFANASCDTFAKSLGLMIYMRCAYFN